MWLNLAVGSLSLPTTDSPSFSIGQRLGLLQQCINALVTYREARRNAAPGPKWTNYQGRPSLVFVAPEYMFLENGFDLGGPLNQNRFLSSGDQALVLNTLKTLSSQYGKQLVLVPGSIASRKPIPADPAAAQRELAGAKRDVREGARYIQGDIGGAPNKKSRLARGEAGPFGGYRAISPAQKLMQLWDMTQRNLNGQPSYLASNVAYMLHNGRIIAQYAKRGDFHEVLPEFDSDSTVYIPGVKSGRATVGGINFGIEICLDHAYGVLRHAPRLTPDLPRIHLICSACVDTDPNEVLVREGGYVVHASSDPGATEIYRLLRGRQNPENYQTINGAGCLLRMGIIELDMLHL